MALTLAIGMRTFNRKPRRNYLKQTLGSMESSGAFDSPLLEGFALMDSGSEDFMGFLQPAFEMANRCKTDFVVASDHRTPNQNAAAALESAASFGADWVLFMEDDVLVCRDFVGSVSRWLERHGGVYNLFTFGTTHRTVHEMSGSGCESVTFSHRDFFGTTCYALRTAHAADLAKWQAAHQTYGGTPRSHDLLIRNWLTERFPKPLRHVVASVPSFVQHIGDESSLSPGRQTVFRYSWPGPEWVYKKEEKS